MSFFEDAIDKLFITDREAPFLGGPRGYSSHSSSLLNPAMFPTSSPHFLHFPTPHFHLPFTHFPTPPPEFFHTPTPKLTSSQHSHPTHSPIPSSKPFHVKRMYAEKLILPSSAFGGKCMMSVFARGYWLYCGNYNCVIIDYLVD